MRSVSSFVVCVGLLAVVSVATIPRSAVAQDDEVQPVVAVMDIRYDGWILTGAPALRMNEYLSSRLAGAKYYLVVPRDQVARALVEQKVRSQEPCYGSCQVTLGGAVGANKILQTKMMKVGKACSLVADLYDMQTETMEKSETAKGLACTEEGLMSGIETVAASLGGKAPVVTLPGPGAPGKSGSSNSTGGFQVSDLPAVPTVTAVCDIGAEGGMGAIDDINLDALEAYDKVVVIDGDRSVTTTDKIRAWEDLGRRFPSYADKAATRVGEWQRYETEKAEAERVEHLRREAMEMDWAKLSRLLKLKVVSDAQKKEWASAFIQAYGHDSVSNVHFLSVLPYTVVVSDRWVLVKPGSFMMGTSPQGGWTSHKEEPQRRVTLTHPLIVMVHEVTQQEWKSLMANNPSYFAACGDQCPVERVSWWEAAAYCNSLSEVEGLETCYALDGCHGIPGRGMTCASVASKGPDCKGYRLPTEAEWEYAARAGSSAELYTGKVSDKASFIKEAGRLGWHADNSFVSYSGSVWLIQTRPERNGTHPVGQKKPNNWGLYDMLGNVWEWCEDWSGHYEIGPVSDPVGPISGDTRVVRSFSWQHVPEVLTVSRRMDHRPDLIDNSIGFRVVRSLF